jgi:hypothetical protein
MCVTYCVPNFKPVAPTIVIRIWPISCMQLHVAFYGQVELLWITQCYLWHQCPAVKARSGHPVPRLAAPRLADTNVDWYSTNILALVRLKVGGQRHAPVSVPPPPRERTLYPLYRKLDECQASVNGFPTGVRILNHPTQRVAIPTELSN